MPQLDPNTFAPQLIWLAITFLALYLIMSRLALPRVGAVLEERAGRLAADIAEAARLRESTDKAIADYEEALANAKQRAHGIAASARESLTADIGAQRRDLDKQISAKMADAEIRIKALKDEAATHIGEIATEVTQSIVARLLGKQANGVDVQGAVKEALGK